MTQKRIMIAAPATGSGKTVLTLGILRALKRLGRSVSSAKAGPDYIDPAFHSIATGQPSINLDPWAMENNRLSDLASHQECDLLIVEAMMGLFDGAADGSGSASDLSETLNCPVVLVVDAARQSHSIAALVKGFKDYRSSTHVAGVILNKVGSQRHEKMLREALHSIDVSVLGAVYRDKALELPERHLGLVQAGETENIEAALEKIADIVGDQIDLDALVSLASQQITDPTGSDTAGKVPPLGQRIAIARDAAFTFIYPHLLTDWRNQGAEISFFSPLANEAPDEKSDAVFLPGGYPELHAGVLSANSNFKDGMKKAAEAGSLIYGECGGYMVLGEGLTDADGKTHSMTGLLSLETSFAKRKLHLGYRRLKAETGFVLGGNLMAHEFHYTSATREAGTSLFTAWDAMGNALGESGLRKNNVMGSYMHVIDRKSAS